MSSRCDGFKGEELKYCTALMDQCEPLNGGVRKSVTLDLYNGKTYIGTDIDMCRTFAKFQSSQGIPAGFKAGPRKISPRQPSTAGVSLSETAKKHIAKRCKAAGTAGTEAFIACEQLMATCYSKKQGPYQLETSSGLQTAGDQDQCFSFSIFYAIFGQPARPGTYVSTDSGADWKSDEKTKFSASFKRVRFALNKGEKIHQQALILPFHYKWTIKGIKITVAYNMTVESGSKYLLRYKVYYGKDSMPKNVTEADLTQAVSFSVSSNDVLIDNLAFGVTLGQAGQFGNVESIEIVKQ